MSENSKIMADKVKVNAVKVNPLKKKEILKYKDLDYNVEYSTLEELVKPLISRIIEDEDQCRNNLLFSKKKFSFRITQLEHCCGISELGGFIVDRTINIEDLTKFFDLLVAGITNHTLIINTNGIDDSKTLETALVKCKNWTAVKKFKNHNSRNMITIWISNNP